MQIRLQLSSLQFIADTHVKLYRSHYLKVALSSNGTYEPDAFPYRLPFQTETPEKAEKSPQNDKAGSCGWGVSPDGRRTAAPTKGVRERSRFGLTGRAPSKPLLIGLPGSRVGAQLLGPEICLGGRCDCKQLVLLPSRHFT